MRRNRASKKWFNPGCGRHLRWHRAGKTLKVRLSLRIIAILSDPVFLRGHGLRRTGKGV